MLFKRGQVGGLTATPPWSCVSTLAPRVVKHDFAFYTFLLICFLHFIFLQAKGRQTKSRLFALMPRPRPRTRPTPRPNIVISISILPPRLGLRPGTSCSLLPLLFSTLWGYGPGVIHFYQWLSNRVDFLAIWRGNGEWGLGIGDKCSEKSRPESGGEWRWEISSQLPFVLWSLAANRSPVKFHFHFDSGFWSFELKMALETNEIEEAIWKV